MTATMTTIKVDFDRDRWLYLPESWPWNGFAGLDQWADTVSTLLAEAHELDAGMTEWLGTSLRSISAGRPKDESRFIYLAAPDRFIFFVSVLYTEESDFTLEDLAVVADPAVTRPPDTQVIDSDHLGAGLRAVRYVDVGAPDHDIAAIAQYAWKSDGLDIVLIAANFNLVLLDDLLPLVDELARSISVARV